MHVSGLHLVNFMGHADTVVLLPRTGVVTVRGPNGAGKSALIEAVSVAGWGKTLRGTDPWSAPEGGVNLASHEGLNVAHQRGPRGAKIVIKGQPEFETATKAKEHLATVLGPWDLWRRSRVFSSADSSSFTGATDADRKRLLEAVLGLDRFDAALLDCRAHLKETSARLSSADVARRLAERDLEHVQEGMAALAAESPTVADAQMDATMKARLAAADVDRLQAQKLREGAAAKIAELSDQIAGWRAAVHAADDKIKAGTAAVCGACGQAVPASVGAEIVEAAKKDRNDAALACHRAEERRTAARAEEQAASRRMNELALEAGDLRAKLRASADGAAKAARARAAAEAKLSSAQEALLEAMDAVAIIEAEGVQLQACERVLGTRGVRARVLGRALDGLAQIASDHLLRMFPEDGAAAGGYTFPVSVRFAGDDKDAEVVTDRIVMSVDGAGGGEGYKALSGGQRRRVDVAVMLALAAIADAGAGTAATGGTVFCDEVFDALDQEGQDAVVAVLSELAVDRAVVVISHSPELLARLPAILALEVVGGAVL